MTCLQGDYEQGERYLREGLHAARQCGNPEYVCAALTNLGDVALGRGEYEQAEQYLQEGLQLARQLSLRPLLCRSLYQWGELALQRKQLEVGRHLRGDSGDSAQRNPSGIRSGTVWPGASGGSRGEKGGSPTTWE